jgi:hypothetical protein
MNPTWKAVLGVLLIFIFGWIAGAISSSVLMGRRALNVYRGGPVAVEQVMERRMTRNLDLDDAQRQQIHGYLMEDVEQRIQLQQQIQPQIRTMNRQTLGKIAAVLRPDQAEKFQANLAYFRMHAGRSFFSPAGEGSSNAAETNSNVGSPPAAR